MIAKPSRPYQIIISGFHRSGTSLTAQYLHRAGLHLGDNLMGANPSNADGHFEDLDIVSLHKDMLTANQRDWFTPGPGLSEGMQGFEERATSVIAKFPDDKDMGFKDPRSSLCLPWWHEQLEQPAAVIVFRHYASCYHSLRNRQAQNLTFDPSRHREALFFWQEPEQALQLWIDYNLAIIDYVKSHRDTTLLVSHHSLLQGFNLPSALNRQLGMTLDIDCDSGIRSGSSDTAGIRETVDGRLQHRLDETLAVLNGLCYSEHEPAVRSEEQVAKQTTCASFHKHIESIRQQCDRLRIAAVEVEAEPESQPQGSVLPVEPTNLHEAGTAEQSDDLKQLVQWGKQHQAVQSLEAAEACWLKAHELAPKNFSVLLQLALLERNRGEHEKTVALMQQAIRLRPADAGYHVHLAQALNQTGKPDQALGIVQHGLTLQTDHLGLHLLQVELLSVKECAEAAFSACSVALDLFPDNLRLVKFMIELTRMAGDSSTAMYWYRRAILIRMRQQSRYRQTLVQVLEQMPVHIRASLSQRVFKELSQLDS